ncbi:U5 small nuclear ribonucleoprotein 40 kDa protein [Spatholobus suberectus]|nr:U5 small nuclear ribonucleoprotein 40 kDa protein [Spatholobus suberectus]
MQVFSNKGENASSVVGPRPMEWSTVPYSAPLAPGQMESSRPQVWNHQLIMLLSSHQSVIYTMKFKPAGLDVAFGSHDREIFLWNVHRDCKNFMVL